MRHASCGVVSAALSLARSLQTNSALLANTLALDKLNEHDGVEVRAAVLERRRCCPRARLAHRLGPAPDAWGSTG